jgi:thiol:disulfide interchange protein DsbC
MRSLAFSVLCAAASLLVAGRAFAATPEETAQRAISAIAPGLKVEAVQDAAVPGFYEVIASGEFLYVSKDGRYAIEGGVYDVANKRDITAASRAKLRKAALDKIGPDKRITFAPQSPTATKYRVTVFTDVDCPFCRRFHQQIAAYNAKGIAVDYLFFPLSIHPGADKKAEAVWCSKDRANTFTTAMAGTDPGRATCPNPVPELTKLAQSLGIGGTPTVLAADGTQIAAQTAMSPDQLAAELDRLAKADVAKN